MRTRPQLNGRAVTVTPIDCPLCVAAGIRTTGGLTPKLRTAEGDPKLFCLAPHGYITDDELNGKDAGR